MCYKTSNGNILKMLKNLLSLHANNANYGKVVEWQERLSNSKFLDLFTSIKLVVCFRVDQVQFYIEEDLLGLVKSVTNLKEVL